MRDLRARDWWLYPVTVREGVNDLFRINETGVGGNGIITVTIPPGKYYCHLTMGFVAPYVSLYKTIENLLSLSSAANGYTFENATPLLSNQQIGSGIRITDAVIEWRIEWPAQSIGREWFGLDHAGGNTVATNSGGIWSVQSSHCCRGRHRTTGLGSIDGIATEKRRTPTVNSQWSHDRPGDRRGIVWHTDYGFESQYVYVLAANVLAERAKLESYATVAGLYPGDQNNAFEHLWLSLARGESVICVHDDDSWGGHVNYANAYVDSHTMKKLGNTSLDQSNRLRATSGEAYDLSIDTWIIHGNDFFNP